MSVLCLDFGNTNCKACIFSGGEIIHRQTFSKRDCLDEIKICVSAYRPETSILSSVIYNDKSIEMYLASVTKFIKVGTDFPLPVILPDLFKGKMGADRLALAVGAIKKFPRQNRLVIALGTCITYNFINATDIFIGGSITPGIWMRFKAMHEKTDLLPEIKPPYPTDFPLIAYDTKTHLLSGVGFGVAAEVGGIIAMYEVRFKNITPILTGGDMRFVQKLLKKDIFADEFLLFKGLYAISQSSI